MTLAIAATVLGLAGTLSVAACRTALRYVDLAVVPRHLMPRVQWWRAHAVPALHASLTVLAIGVAGLLIAR